MKKLDSILENRLSTNSSSNEKSVKVRSLAERSNRGELSGYSPLLSTSELSSEEKKTLEEILQHYTKEVKDSGLGDALFQKNLEELSHITQEVKSIAQQSILLHGERIRRAQTLLASYTDGAFSAWLIAIYGNRQTPYNFLLYYQFYTEIEIALQHLVERMPKQAIYTLASRDAPISEKAKLVEKYHGESKEMLLEEIRRHFPLSSEDKRAQLSFGKKIHREIEKQIQSMQKHARNFTKEEKRGIKEALQKAIHTLS